MGTIHSDDVTAALADPATLAMLRGYTMATVSDDEILIVAQAIADAHHRKPGADASGRLDDARTIIAAVDALMQSRLDASRICAADAAVASVSSTASEDTAHSMSDASSVDSSPVSAASSAASQVIPIGKKKPKGKGA